MRLQARVNLIRHVRVRPARPVPTRLSKRARDVQIPHIVRTFENLDIESSAEVPRDVAVERPHARVVLVPLHNEIGRRIVALGTGEHGNVAASWVVRIAVNVTVVFASTSGEDEHVVAVQVHWVWSAFDVVVPDHADGRVGSHIVDIPRPC